MRQKKVKSLNRLLRTDAHSVTTICDEGFKLAHIYAYAGLM